MDSRSQRPSVLPDSSSNEYRHARDLVGASPPFGARPVSLAARDSLRQRAKECGSLHGVLAAVSGGADSLALAVAAAAAAAPLGVPFTACVVDHRMREGSSVEAQQVVAVLEELGISTRILTAAPKNDSGRGPSTGLEAAARDLRHALLETAAQDWMKSAGLSSVDIVLGHTMDDQAETVLLRLGRGASPDALSSMRKVVPTQYQGISKVRPLLGLRRADTESFCDSLGLIPVQDPTNRADGPWRTRGGQALPRSAVRERVLPALGEALGQDPVIALARVADLLAEDRDALTDAGRKALDSSTLMVTEGASMSLDVQSLSRYLPAVRKRALRAALTQIGAPMPGSTHLESLDQSLFHRTNAQGDPRVVTLPGGLIAKREGEALVFRTSSASDE